MLYIVDFGSESRFYVSERNGVLFLVQMCEPDGSEASDTFFNGAILSRVMYEAYQAICVLCMLSIKRYTYCHYLKQTIQHK